MPLAVVREEWADLEYLGRTLVSVLSRPRFVPVDMGRVYMANGERLVSMWLVRVLVPGESEPRNVALERIPAMAERYAAEVAEVAK